MPELRPAWTQLLVGAAVWSMLLPALGTELPASEPQIQTGQLQIEGPLKPSVKVARQGRVLVLSYRLAGSDGEPYTRQVPSGRPEFTVYKGQRKIASGQFEYG